MKSTILKIKEPVKFIKSRSCFILAIFFFLFIQSANKATAQNTAVKISQVYGGGGSASGATYTKDYVELYNSSCTPVSVAGWVIEYGSATGNWGSSASNYFTLPAGVTLEVDKTGQLLTFKSADKELLGQTCGQLRFLRPVEPYKGTGIRVTTDVVIRKTGKTKAG